METSQDYKKTGNEKELQEFKNQIGNIHFYLTSHDLNKEIDKNLYTTSECQA